MANNRAGQPADHDGVLVDAGWLEARLNDPAVRVVEVDVSRANYDQWHIDGAVLWNVYADLKDADYHTADAAALRRVFSRSGISPETTVVCYGYAPAMGMWLLKLHGHADVRILDCSRETWRAEGHPCSTTATEATEVSYPPRDEDGGIRATAAQVGAAIGEPGITLADVRTENEYAGERFWPSGGMEPGGRAGHVPGAVHVPMDVLYDDRGAFLPAADLRRMLKGADLDGDGDVITYCTIGGRASTAWFILTYLLDRDHVRVYDGSWAEWGRADHTQVVQPNA
jgi:thiosulfate/3-mercaptopyruvate sulfurtransferase